MQAVPIAYQKQVAYTLQAVDGNNQPIANLPVTATATGIVGSAKRHLPLLAITQSTKIPTRCLIATTNDNPIQIQYTPKAVAVALMPVDGNGNPITDLAPITVTQAGGTQLNESTLPQPGCKLTIIML